MFTGLVEEVGWVTSLEHQGEGASLWIEGPAVVEGTQPGDSIAVNGVCLTVTELHGSAFRADVMRETLKWTTLGGLSVRQPVNLERAVPVGGRLGGHIVQGHVDGVGHLQGVKEGLDWHDHIYGLPPELARYVARKGSIAIDGVSLTVTWAEGDQFGVSLIPATMAGTTLGNLRLGDAVNLETDVIAKYVERLVAR
ncbi:MAG: riboflavin synthase [Bifidobacteriaceae bacterium]|nr:riboflavin synthase [Bifidobacteriaceae bacterium]